MILRASKATIDSLAIMTKNTIERCFSDGSWTGSTHSNPSATFRIRGELLKVSKLRNGQWPAHLDRTKDEQVYFFSSIPLLVCT